MATFASNGPISEPVRLDDEIEPDVAMGGFAFSVTDGIYIPVDVEDPIDTPPLPLPQEVEEL